MDLIDELPRGSHYRAAVADDDDIAEAVFDLKPRSSSPPLEDWTAEIEALTGIQDLLFSLLYRGSDQRPPRLPRPETAMDRVEKRRIAVKKTHVLSQLLPGQ
ncbi:hypothetical protein SFC07_11025 [Corynebacterium callunae]|uniref:hypothetical protein n=1 Tax=Corynebacterium callunae TaxID=1721 RepID=UPI0039827816